MKPTAFIAGAAQLSLRPSKTEPWKGEEPASLVARAAKLALADAGASSRLDAIACVESFAWSYGDLAGQVADSLGCTQPLRRFSVPTGGNSPQDLLHQVCSAIAAGEIHCALIAGAEVLYSRNRARRENRDLGWPARPTTANPFRGQKPFSSELEQRHGLLLPIQAFPLFENAIRAAQRRSADEQIRLAASILAKNARVAADNPHAWFRDAPSAEDIAAVSSENRMIAYPYTKRMNAIMNVDQAAAIVVISESLMRELSADDRCASVLGGAGAEDAWFVSERNTLAASPGMKAATHAALDNAGLSASQIDAFDLYSCFPSAIEFAMDAFGVAQDDPRPLSLTGGLAFAGGPGNAYVLHALATAVSRLRSGDITTAAVSGVGMACAKHTTTVLARTDAVPAGATGRTPLRVDTDVRDVETVERADGVAEIASYTIDYDRSGAPERVLYILDLPDGRRTVANSDGSVGATAEQLLASEPVGRRGTLAHDASTGTNRFTLDGAPSPTS